MQTCRLLTTTFLGFTALTLSAAASATARQDLEACKAKHVVALDDRLSPANVVGRAVAVACRDKIKALVAQYPADWSDMRRERAAKEVEDRVAEQATVDVLKRRAIQ